MRENRVGQAYLHFVHCEELRQGELLHQVLPRQVHLRWLPQVSAAGPLESKTAGRDRGGTSILILAPSSPAWLKVTSVLSILCLSPCTLYAVRTIRRRERGAVLPYPPVTVEAETEMDSSTDEGGLFLV